MILHDVRLYDQPGLYNILVREGRIISIYQGNVHEPEEKTHWELEGSLALPGFINGHDHLDFNLFPQLGTGGYHNYREWGPRVQSENKALISRVLAVPVDTRIKWGAYKNLLNGFTTVVNHGKHINAGTNPVTIYQEHASLHSPGFEKNWKLKLANPFKLRQTVIIHAGEGTDKAASDELDQLANYNFLKRKLIIVHGVALDEKQAGSFKGLVWCPASNFFLFGKTAAINNLIGKIGIVFGTDSTLTAAWNAWEHFRMALSTGMTRENELLNMLGPAAAALFGLNDRGRLKPGLRADILFVKNSSPVFEQDPGDIQMVLVKGAVQMADETYAPGLIKSGYTKICFGTSCKYVYGNLRDTVSVIKKYYPEAGIPFSID